MTSSFILSSSFILHTTPHPRWQAHPSSPHLLFFILVLILYLFILLLILNDKLLHPLLIFYPHPGWQAHPLFSFIPHSPPHPLSFILLLILDDKLIHPFLSSSFFLHTLPHPLSFILLLILDDKLIHPNSPILPCLLFLFSNDLILSDNCLNEVSM